MTTKKDVVATAAEEQKDNRLSRRDALRRLAIGAAGIGLAAVASSGCIYHDYSDTYYYYVYTNYYY